MNITRVASCSPPPQHQHTHVPATTNKHWAQEHTSQCNKKHNKNTNTGSTELIIILNNNLLKSYYTGRENINHYGVGVRPPAIISYPSAPGPGAPRHPQHPDTSLAYIDLLNRVCLLVALAAAQSSSGWDLGRSVFKRRELGQSSSERDGVNQSPSELHQLHAIFQVAWIILISLQLVRIRPINIQVVRIRPISFQEVKHLNKRSN